MKALFVMLLLPAALSARSPLKQEDLVLVQSGTFKMGSPEDEGYRQDDEILHQVEITRDFYIYRTEISQALWKQVMGSNPSGSSMPRKDNYPVNNVNFFDIMEFCNKLSEIEGLTPAYNSSEDGFNCDFDADGYRLPSEEEWEYAARGGHLSQEYQIYSGSNRIDGIAWYMGNSGNVIHPIAQKAPNILGLYDMTGNLWEWCWNVYQHYEGSSEEPTGIVIRGGSAGNMPYNCRNAFRNYVSGIQKDVSLGFRIVRTVP